MAFALRISAIFCRNYSASSPSILNTKGLPFLTSKQKSRAALALLKSEKDPERILQICREASLTPESHLDRVAYTVAVEKLTATQSFAAIREFIEEHKKRPDLQNERFMVKAILLYGKAGMLDQAIQTFKQMGDLNLTRTVKSLNALLSSCIIAKKYKEVARLFDEYSKDYSIKPDTVTYNTMIKALCESDSSDSALALLKEMGKKGCKPNAISYGNLLAGFYREEKFDKVGVVLDLMERNGCHPGVTTYNVRIQSLCKLKKSSEAMALIRGMVSKGVRPNTTTFYHLIYGFCREGNLEEAKKVFSEMKSRGCVPDSNCYFALLYYLCEGGDYEPAFKLCRESMEKDWVPSFKVMKSLVNGLVKLSKIEAAKEIIGEMKEKFPSNSEMWATVEQGLPQH
ncbi:hypothetical protein AMTRI_Chr02g257110 [Amborella trichopoda]|uniref:Pentacotripeptide-repeat region of PRORP domain-containing protein n=1 Tax=Amborella trichopoda TaxID=13333 RepID=U5D1W2_AMBTC|nr:pentatricopeptide repeat-containing protein At1g61870, mitochondrial [Amborella trichopoda]ERN19591.1 hypothetical protein AMTR_s00062p00111890 [Amborella trichopoda]|eukprot:XP_006858124.1 pentatricopeptide repeat-containing protein At1g61870, mitochondrial [Amborella trichopoda]